MPIILYFMNAKILTNGCGAYIVNKVKVHSYALR